MQSKNANYPEGKLLLASIGWRDRTVLDLGKPKSDSVVLDNSVIPAWNTGDFPSSLSLGILGMPGSVMLHEYHCLNFSLFQKFEVLVRFDIYFTF